MKAKAFLNWSSGKDAAYTLQLLNTLEEYNVEALVTTVNSENNRVSMHGLRAEFLELQAEALGLKLKTIALHGQVSMESYNKTMQDAVSALKISGFTHSVFGDIFLEDLKSYRETQLQDVGICAVFPLWKKSTTQLSKEIIASGVKAIVVCVNANVLDKSFCGREYNEQFLEDLPKEVDPCGENGEFHTFVYDSPLFKNSIKFNVGDIVNKTYKPVSKGSNCHKDNTTWDTSFWYADLLPN